MQIEQFANRKHSAGKEEQTAVENQYYMRVDKLEASPKPQQQQQQSIKHGVG